MAIKPFRHSIYNEYDTTYGDEYRASAEYRHNPYIQELRQRGQYHEQQRDAHRSDPGNEDVRRERDYPPFGRRREDQF